MAGFSFAALACSGPPQKPGETAITYNASFTGQPGSATIVFPAPNDNAESTVLAGLVVSDGGTASSYQDGRGQGFSLIGLTGAISASFSDEHLSGLGDGTGLPTASLDRQVPDGGPNDYYFVVNKAGEPLVDVVFEYTAQRNCGGGCGGKKSWTYTGPVGAGLQAITVNYTEEKTP